VGILYVKAFHVIFMVTWFAGLFYLPRLFVHHAMTTDAATKERFKIMERKLAVMMDIGATLTMVFGFWLLFSYGWSQYKHNGWLHVKLTAVALLVVYHVWCRMIVRTFRNDANQRSHKWYRVFNEVPTLLLILIVIIVVVRPF
jgi:protoporphyrinogen IX oxidase